MPTPSNKKFSGIFVSYRREDTAGHAGRLFDRLVEHFGRDRIFMDIDTIEPGEDFVTVIENAVGSCDVLIAMIGRNWLTTSGTGRLDKPNDFVRLEIATALSRDIRVIPVLVQRASIPKPQDLPEDLASLTRRNAVELTDLRWQTDVDQLITVMERILAKRSQTDPAVDERTEDEVDATKHVAALPAHESDRAATQARPEAPPIAVQEPRPFYKNRTVMLIAGAFLAVLLVTGIILWLSPRDQPTSANTNQAAVAQPSVTEQPAPPTATPTPEEVKKPVVDIELVLVPAGSFMMGSPEGENTIVGELPLHEVTFRDGFYMSKYEVTQAQWQAVMGNNPSHFKNCDNCPVENVSWLDVQSFLEKLNESSNKYTYRLPSEAEWEYACRAGTTGNYAGPLAELAWYDANAEGKTHPVGSKTPNAFGLYDMHGNVWEWCEDVHYGNYEGAPSDGSARLKEGARERMARGGSWQDDKFSLRSAHRAWDTPKNREYILGFRVVAVAVAD